MSKHSKQQAAETRVEIYAAWLRDDADGLAFNLPPADPASLDELRNARATIRAALRTIDQAIENCEREGLRAELADALNKAKEHA